MQAYLLSYLFKAKCTEIFPVVQGSPPPAAECLCLSGDNSKNIKRIDMKKIRYSLSCFGEN